MFSVKSLQANLTKAKVLVDEYMESRHYERSSYFVDVLTTITTHGVRSFILIEIKSKETKTSGSWEHIIHFIKKRNYNNVHFNFKVPKKVRI